MKPRPSGAPHRQMPFEFDHDVSHAEDDFMAGESNRLALAHIRAFPAWPQPSTLLMGPPKAGKSHLARIWQERAGARPITPGDLEPLPGGEPAEPLVIEDVDRTGYAEAPLFHLLNQSMRDRRPLLMTARTPIADWPFATDDLKSRARLATLVTVDAADDMLLSHMLVKLFADRQVAVEPRVIGYIVPRMERSAEEAVLLVDLMDRIALERGCAITRTVAGDALATRWTERGRGGAFDLEGYGNE